jgi:hypothetical protein
MLLLCGEIIKDFHELQETLTSNEGRKEGRKEEGVCSRPVVATTLSGERDARRAASQRQMRRFSELQELQR